MTSGETPSDDESKVNAEIEWMMDRIEEITLQVQDKAAFISLLSAAFHMSLNLEKGNIDLAAALTLNQLAKFVDRYKQDEDWKRRN
ncbi:hypothetical protein KOR42_23840 [Thalassoglobus neptunius]|uniref:Uncharacterized protein n=1 Tax=Thalassoglobus neptunius TaxID=1938619 RepID=A0A5C5X7A2_9PLAN|nr:hypothetical protein [Thalassoglobus neptunius]TWT58997.1 hypothetical protein KOR42_23840 [Thalassoglobus neptunius]